MISDLINTLEPAPPHLAMHHFGKVVVIRPRQAIATIQLIGRMQSDTQDFYIVFNKISVNIGRLLHRFING